MKLFLNILFLFCPLSTLAYPCPDYLSKRKDAQKALTWLKKFEGTQNLGGCTLEIVTCSDEGPNNSGAPVAEILVTDTLGREAYVSVDFPKRNSLLFSTKVKKSSRFINIKKKDRFYEHLNGRTEVWRLEIRTDWLNTTKLDAFELGIYSTNNQLNQANGNDSYWYVCYNEND